MTNLIYSTLATISLSDPAIFWAFIGLLALAVVLTYLHSLRAGLVATVLVSGFLFWVGEFLPFIYVPLIAALIIFFLDLFGLGNIGGKIEDFNNWLYLKYRVRKFKKRLVKKQE